MRQRNVTKVVQVVLEVQQVMNWRRTDVIKWLGNCMYLTTLTATRFMYKSHVLINLSWIQLTYSCTVKVNMWWTLFYWSASSREKPQCTSAQVWQALHLHTRNEPYMPLPSQLKLGRIYRTRRSGRLTWHSWLLGLVTLYRRFNFTRPHTVAHLSINQVPRWLTSLTR